MFDVVPCCVGVVGCCCLSIGIDMFRVLLFFVVGYILCYAPRVVFCFLCFTILCRTPWFSVLLMFVVFCCCLCVSLFVLFVFWHRVLFFVVDRSCSVLFFAFVSISCYVSPHPMLLCWFMLFVCVFWFCFVFCCVSVVFLFLSFLFIVLCFVFVF